MSASTWVLFVAAGATGAVTRYVVDRAVTRRVHGLFPRGTLLVNVTGSFVLGVVTGLGLYHGLAKPVRLVVGTGFCGAYTTFSTFAFESVMLADDDGVAPALANVAATVALSLLAAAAGIALTA